MEKKKYKIGYTQGTYDLFHIGHLNLLENAKAQCEKLVVGVNTDELVMNYKNRKSIIPESERIRIVESIKVVDEVIKTDSLDKKKAFEKVHFDVIFIGDDWKGSQRWKDTENEFEKIGIPVEYLPHTDGISSSKIKDRIINESKKEDTKI